MPLPETMAQPKILLLGKNGQLGWELQRSLSVLGEVVALDRHGFPGWSGDLSQPSALAQTVQQIQPQVIVNAAAYTAVDRAESEPDVAYAINAQAPQILAQEAQKLGAWLVHFSTDYVFNGSGQQPWTETDVCAPLSVYGQTKWQGEQAVVASGCRHLMFRTSWVYGARGGNFAKTMLKLAQERDGLRVIDDQIGAPTGADLLADVTAHALAKVLEQGSESSGTYHLAASGETSWYGYAQFVLTQAKALGVSLKVQPEDVQAIPTSAYPTPVRRPLNSRLDTRKIQDTFGITLPHWTLGVARMLEETQT
jgi:dTDP-4-dehydrorhamnose reductase